MSGQHRIEVWSFPVLGASSPVSHRFLVLVDANNNVVKELHGGARGPNDTFQTTAPAGILFVKEGTPGLRGTDGNLLLYNENPVASSGPAGANSRREYEIASGTQAEMEQRWAAANEARVAINAKELPYLPAPTGVIGDSNSNGSLGASVKAVSELTYKNEPSFFGTPGSETSPLTPAEINAARAAAGLPPRTGQEDTVLVGSEYNAESGKNEPTYTRINGVTGEVMSREGHIRTPTGEYVAEVQNYENNPATPGNLLETRTEFDPLDIRPEVSRTETYNPDGTLTGVVNDYDDAASWRATHSLNDAHLARFDEAAVHALSQEIERSAFHCGSVPESTPWVLSYESQFSAAYDYNAGNDHRLIDRRAVA
jgi:hypothetical protein